MTRLANGFGDGFGDFLAYHGIFFQQYLQKKTVALFAHDAPPVSVKCWYTTIKTNRFKEGRTARSPSDA